MATATETVVRALRELRYIDLFVADEDVPSAVTDHGLDVLSRMMATWPAHGLRILDADLVFTGTTVSGSREITDLESEDDLHALSEVHAGMYVSGTGVPGSSKVTKVTSTTALLISAEATASGSVELTFNDLPLDERFEDAVICMLAVRLSSSTGMPVTEEVATRAREGWASLQAFFIQTPEATFDDALVSTQSTRRTATFTGNE